MIYQNHLPKSLSNITVGNYDYDFSKITFGEKFYILI